MAYCPSCGREQRCGCDKCHTCGVELVVDRGRTPLHDSPALEAVHHEADAPPPLPGPNRALAAALLTLGCGVLVVTVIEAINSAMRLPTGAGASTAADGLKRITYYLGNLLYSSSVRGMTGFALVAAGLNIAPGWPFHRPEQRADANRAAALVMGMLGAVCVLDSLLLALPFGSTSVMLRDLLPSLWAAVLIILATGVALLAGAYALLPGGRARSAAGRRRAPAGPGGVAGGAVGGTAPRAVKSSAGEGAGREGG